MFPTHLRKYVLLFRQKEQQKKEQQQQQKEQQKEQQKQEDGKQPSDGNNSKREYKPEMI